MRRLAAVVPAAGASRRMGRPKLLMPWPAGEGEAAGGTVLGALTAALDAGGAGEISLVLAPADDTDRGRAAAALAAWARERSPGGCRLTLAENPEPGRGMLSSILAGLEVLGGAGGLASAGTALLVTPADLPALSPATVAAVAAALGDGAPIAVPTHHGRRGHPLGLAPHLLPEIPTLDLDRGLRQLLDRHAAAVVEVAVEDPGAVRDVDTPEEYAELAARALPRDGPA